MRFIYPDFLPALAFVIIPILIHFIHFKRYKTIYFSQVSFLKAVQQDSKKKNNLKQLLILASRILTIIALVFVFCQPYLPVNKQERKTSGRLVAVYIDNSFSMKNESDNGTLLELAKSKAMDIANSYGPGTSFLLMNNQNSPDQQQLLNNGQLISRLSAIKESPGSLPISKVHQFVQNNLLKQKVKSEKTIYLISDFQEYTSDFAAVKADTNIHTLVVPLKSQAINNLVIDSCWFETPGRKKGWEETLFVRIQNQSAQAYQDIPVRLKINDTIKAIHSLNIEPEEKKEIELVYKNNQSGTHRGIVELDDYPIVYDNQFYFSYDVREKNNVLTIYQTGDQAINYLESLFLNDENMTFTKTEEKKIQVSQFQNYQCIFLLNLKNPGSALIQGLSAFIEGGGSLAVFPGNDINTQAYNELYRTLQAGLIVQADSTRLRMERLNLNHPLLQQVFLHEKENLELPTVSYSYRFSRPTTSQQTSVVDFNNDQPALTGYPFENGQFYQFSFPLDKNTTDLNQHAIFVPLVYNIALNSYEHQQTQYKIQNNLVLELTKKQVMNRIQRVAISPYQSDEKIVLPLLSEYGGQMRIDLQNTIDKAGFYNLLINDDIYKTLAFNFNRSESLSKQMTTGQLQRALERSNIKTFDIIESDQTNFTEKIKAANEGIELWKLFLLLVLVFIGTEIAITRF